jgi:hypothetical protein
MWAKQKEALNFAIDRADHGKGVALFMDCGTGKALPLTTPILTPTGWTTMREIKIGDFVVGSGGKPTKVLGVYPQGEQEIYRITFSDRTTADCTGDHLWEVTTGNRKKRGQASLILSAVEMLQQGLKITRGNRKFFIPMVAPIQFRERPITIDPYLLGLLLGDGYLRKGCVSLSTGDSEILNAITQPLFNTYGISPKHRGRYDYNLTNQKGKKNGLVGEVKSLGLAGTHAATKFIPDNYIYNSIEIRLALLQGLLDADGSVAATGVEYTTASPSLAKQVAFLVQSFGGIATTTTRFPKYTYKGEKRTGRMNYRLYLRFPKGINPFRLSRKEIVSRSKYWPIRAVESIESYDFAPVQCIKVAAPDGLFVINDCILTHNTRTAIHWLEHLFATKEAKLVYVAAPLSALHVWIENWHLWAKAPVAFIDLHESGSAGLRRAKELAADGWPVVCLVNYEAAWQLGWKRIIRKRQGEEVRILEKVDTAMHDLNWDVGILDESTFIKSPGSKVSKFFRRKLAPRTTYRMILSGSAYVKRPLDVWAQCNFAVGDEVFAPAFLPFKMQYSIPHQYIRGAILGYKNLDDLVRRLANVAVMLKKTDVLDLPPFVHETRMVELCPKSRKVYQDLVDEALAELDTGEVTSDHVFTMIRKLAQITSGFVYPDCDPETPDIKPAPVRLGTEKLDVLMEILENRDSPTVVIVQMDEEERMIVEAVQKRFKFTPKVLNGSVHGAEARHKMIESASNDPVFIMKESVGARGIDVKFADMMVFYAHSYNTEAYTQILSRNHRGGQTHSITYIHLLAKSTIDLKIMKALEKDLNLADSIERDWRKLFE